MTEFQKLAAHIGGALIAFSKDAQFPGTVKVPSSTIPIDAIMAPENVTMTDEMIERAEAEYMEQEREREAKPKREVEPNGPTIRVKLTPAIKADGTLAVDVHLFDVPEDGFNSFQFEAELADGGLNAVPNHPQAADYAQWTTHGKINVVARNGKVGAFTSSDKAISESGIITRLVFTNVSKGSFALVLDGFRLSNSGTSTEYVIDPDIPILTGEMK